MVRNREMVTEKLICFTMHMIQLFVTGHTLLAEVYYVVITILSFVVTFQVVLF